MLSRLVIYRALCVLGLIVLPFAVIPNFSFLPLIAYSLVFDITKLEVVDNKLVISRIISPRTPQQIYEIFEDYPEIDTLVMKDVPGSIDDLANLEIANWLVERGVNTEIGRYGHISSGGVDLFMVGRQRTVVEGALIGVHSWGVFDTAATDFPRGSPEHQRYLDFYQHAGLSAAAAENFYYFTINAAPPEDVYFMRLDEIISYRVTNTGITPPPFVVLRLERQRARQGHSHITAAEARQRGIPIITYREYQQRLYDEE